MNAAYKAALDTIAAQERTFLSAADHEAFFAALDNPQEPTAGMRAAFAHHRKTVTSR